MREKIFQIWRSLFKFDVKFIVVGGFAVNFYGYNRNTGDLDLLLEDSAENRKRLRNAFRELGLGDFKELESIPFLAGWTDISLDFGLRLDLMSSLKGLEDYNFEQLKTKATIVELDGVLVDFLDYQSLIKTKVVCGRPKDILDIEELQKINRSENT
jgi:predicted nucleotidyltransferase